MRRNETKEKLLRGDAVFGSVLQQYRSVEIVRAFAAAGFDYVFIDAEHGAFDIETIQDLARACCHTGLTALVRVAELSYGLVARALDVGADGVILPRVEDPEVLREAVLWTKFPPLGKRGFGITAPRLDYEAASFPDIIRHSNDNTLVVVQFETRTALERAEELLAVPGVDVGLVGPSDLSIALGVPGEFDSPVLRDAVVRFIETCARFGVVPGIQVRTVALATEWLRRGMRFVGCGSEHTMLLERARETVGVLRAAAVRAAGAER